MLSSEDNSIVISNSESLRLSSNLIFIYCDKYNFNTDRLPVQLSSDTDTEIIYTPEFWNSVISGIDPDLPNKDLEAYSCALYPDFYKFSTVSLLS